MSSAFAAKTGLMVSFLLKGLLGITLASLMGTVTLVLVAGVAIGIFSGDWSVGMDFPTWYRNIGAEEIAPGVFSSVDSVCFACEAFSALFDIMNVAGLRMFEFIHETVWVLMVLAFAVWILHYVFTKIIIDGKADIKEVTVDIFKKVFWIAVIGSAIGFMSVDRLRATAGAIINTTAVPVLSLGVSMGTGLLDTDICDHLAPPPPSEAVPEYLRGVLPNQIKADFLCLVNTINVVYVSGIKAGARMMTLAARAGPRVGGVFDVMGGLIIAAVFFMMLIRIPFKLVDIIFTIGILIAFIPMFIAGYAYDQTKGLAKQGLDSLVGIMFRLAVMSLFIGIVYAMFLYIGDAFYPGPADGFTFLFPDFVFRAGTSNAAMSQVFLDCYDRASDLGLFRDVPGYFCDCVEAAGMECALPSRAGITGTVVPIIAMGMFANIILSKEKEYSGIFSGYMFDIGNSIYTFGKSAFEYVFGGVKRAGDVFVKRGQDTVVDKGIERLKGLAGRIRDAAGRRRTT